MSSTITVFYPDCETWRIVLAYFGYVTPSILLLSLLAFYDPKTTICYKFESTFLLDNSHEPILNRLAANENIIEDFQTFHTKFFSTNDSDQDDYKPGNFVFYNENYNLNYDWHTTEVEDMFSWTENLENLSIPNKYILLKSLGIKDTLRYKDNLFPSRNYYHQILANFKSANFIKNLLSLLREFGFLHFCSETFIRNDNYRVHGKEGAVVDYLLSSSPNGLIRFGDSWWRGYSPLDVDYSDDFEILLDAFLVFEEDERFSEHLVCLAKIYDIDPNVLYQDFINIRDLKVSKNAIVVRKGEYFNRAFSLYFRDDFNNSSRIGEHIVIKYFTGVIEALRQDIDGIPSSCENQSRYNELLDEFNDDLLAEVNRTLYDQFGIEYDYDLRMRVADPKKRISQASYRSWVLTRVLKSGHFQTMIVYMLHNFVFFPDYGRLHTKNVGYNVGYT